MENSQSLSNVAENWYSRLNKLKDRYESGNLTPHKEAQLKKLIGIMIGRMMKLMPQYLEAKHKRFKPNLRFMLKGTKHN